MNLNQTINVVLIIIFTLLSGIADSQGFIHASKVWKNGNLLLKELMYSALGFGIGIVFYWITLRYLQRFGVLSSEVQALGWFTVTIIGVAIINKNFLSWSRLDQIVGLALLVGVGWLILRTSG